jgi:cell division protease FtsH
VFGEISTGAQNDLQQATEIARAMVVEYGMSPKLGPVSFGQDGYRMRDGRSLFGGDRPEISDTTARVIDEEVARLINEAHDRARVILEKDREMLAKLSDVLIEREVIEGAELRRYLSGEAPIPTKEELDREGLEKRNGQTDQTTGPDIIASAPPFGSREERTQEIPARPD